jgi:hypothetical protein
MSILTLKFDLGTYLQQSGSLGERVAVSHSLKMKVQINL